jgi:hypothetical protein
MNDYDALSKKFQDLIISPQNNKISYNDLIRLFLNTLKRIFNEKVEEDDSIIIKNELLNLIKLGMVHLTADEFQTFMNRKMVFDSYMYDEVRKPIEFITIGLAALDPNNLITLKQLVPNLWIYLENNIYFLHTLIIECCLRRSCIRNTIKILADVFDKNIVDTTTLVNQVIAIYYYNTRTGIGHDMLCVEWGYVDYIPFNDLHKMVLEGLNHPPMFHC